MIKYMFFIVPLLSINFLTGCGSDAEKYPTPAEYDFNHPVSVDLPSELNEISGIIYYPKDTSLFAISDATGWLYKIFPNRNTAVQKWKFGKNQDYEDVQLVDSSFYILSSNGNIVKLKFSPDDSVHVEQFEFPETKGNEFESLFYDSTSHLLNIICKNCKHETKDKVSIWTFNPSTDSFALSPVTIDISSLAKQSDQKKIELKPSAAAINPLTNELYIISSVNKVLVITDKTGIIKKAYSLNPGTYKQPEGMAFTTSGDLVISNESADAGAANILILKYKKKTQ